MNVFSFAQQRIAVAEHPFSRRLFSEVGPVSGFVWTAIRVMIGWSWLSSGWGKVTGDGWGPSVLRAYWERAVAVPEQGRPPITYGWYRDFLTMLLDTQAESWMAGAIAAGEVLVGIALILGALVGIAAFFGAFMNMNFMLAGTASTNPVLLIGAVTLMLAWKTAGWWGLDRWLLPSLGTPWSPVSLAEPLIGARKGYVGDIERQTLENTLYRKVLYTAQHSQLVLMSIRPGDEIGEEIHHLDQFIRFEAGSADVLLDGVRHDVGADSAVVIPAGMRHNVINVGKEDLKLYTVYSPPEHKDGTVHATKADEKEEHFDGITTE